MDHGLANILFYVIVVIAGIIAVATIATWIAPIIAIGIIVYLADKFLSDDN